MPALLLRPTVILSILLLISMAVSAGLYKLHVHDLEAIATLKAAQAQLKASIAEQNAAVEKLRKEALAKDASIRSALAAAAKERMLAEHRAEETLQLRPSNPADACASALDLNRAKLLERRTR